jgi:hypothetical protein
VGGQKWQLQVGQQKWQPKAKGQKAKVATKTTHLKWEPKVKGQNRSLRVSSLSSLQFFALIFSPVVVGVKKAMTTCCHCHLLYVCEEEDDCNAPSSSSMVLL